MQCYIGAESTRNERTGLPVESPKTSGNQGISAFSGNGSMGPPGFEEPTDPLVETPDGDVSSAANSALPTEIDLNTLPADARDAILAILAKLEPQAVGPATPSPASETAPTPSDRRRGRAK